MRAVASERLDSVLDLFRCFTTRCRDDTRYGGLFNENI